MTPTPIDDSQRVVPVDLLPCPFCNAEPAYFSGTNIQYGHGESSDYAGVRCSVCRVEISFCNYAGYQLTERMALAAEKWNRRAPAASPPVAPVVGRTPRVFVDMDGVIVDFNAYREAHGLTGDEVKSKPGTYLAMPAIPGAIEAVRSLIGMGYEVWIATKPPTGIAFAYADKAQWIMDNIPELKRRIIVTHDKGLLGQAGDYLIDDRPHKANCERFAGTLIRFTDGVTWADVLDRLRKDSRSPAPLAAAQEGVKPIPACWRYVHADPSNSSGWMDYDGDAELWELRGKKAQANGLTIELAYSRPTAQTQPATPADRMDGERLDWLMRQVRGDEFRRIGIHTSAGCTRAALDAAREG